MKTRFETEGLLTKDRKGNYVEIVRFFGGDAARQRADKLAASLHTGEVYTIDELTWENKPAYPTIPNTSVAISHVVAIEAAYAE